jgi:2-polyprenyl-6-methoxyphenol hydroxylase-like FAD-dependent oxidoreductase
MVTPDTSQSAPVIVVGAGPVGTVLALELARHGVSCTVLERAAAASRHPKMDYVNGRSMELLRRLGIAEEIRTHGIPADLPADFLWSRDFAEPPLAVWHYESPAALGRRYAAVTDGSAPLEPYQRVQGSLLEEVLRRCARQNPLVDLREGWTFTDVRETADGVVATVVEPATRTRRLLHARYLVGCDGARSAVRQCLDIPVELAGPTTQNCSVYFRSSDPVLRRHGRAFVTIAARGLTLVSRDERDTWTGSFPVPAGEPVTLDPVSALQDRLGARFAAQVLSVAQWAGSLGVAASYRRGAVFLAGDAAHQFYPTGGYGANTGLADAVDLGWKLAARVQGWGGSRLLDSYEAERRPVALFNREMCANLLEVWRRFGRLVSAGASREQVAGFLDQETYQIDNVGVHFGYRYTGSPVVWPEPGAPPPGWEWSRITPTTSPGCRAPAVRLDGGTALFDLLGPEHTLVDFRRDGPGEQLAKEANRRGVPVLHLPVDDPVARAVWERDLVLVRPDQHVAWRGDGQPPGWGEVIDRVRGR